jgi:hypothetical protein
VTAYVEETKLAPRQFLLPVSKRRIFVQPPTGAEELLLLETVADETQLALALARALARDTEGTSLEWSQLSATDLDAFLLNLRRAWIGDQVRCNLRCAAEGCGERIVFNFTITRFLADHRPTELALARRGWRVRASDETGWHGLESETARLEFRLPTPDDQLMVASLEDAEKVLAGRCMRPANLPARIRRCAEAAIEKLAPSLSCEMRGTCPHCGALVSAYFDARGFCLKEFRNRAAFIYQDVDALARHYHWSEPEILRLPHARRSAYAEMACSAGGGQP